MYLTLPYIVYARTQSCRSKRKRKKKTQEQKKKEEAGTKVAGSGVRARVDCIVHLPIPLIHTYLTLYVPTCKVSTYVPTLNGGRQLKSDKSSQIHMADTHRQERTKRGEKAMYE